MYESRHLSLVCTVFSSGQEVNYQQKPREVEVRKFESKAFPGVALYNERVDSLRRYDKVWGQFMGHYLK